MCKRVKYSTIVLTVCILLFTSSCSGVAEHANFLGLLRLVPKDLSNNTYILINYKAIWKDAGINFNPRNQTRINREETVNIALSSLSRHIAGDSALRYSSFYSGNDGSVKLSPIGYDTLGYNLIADVDAEIIRFKPGENGYMLGMSGSFSVEATRSALQNQDGWPSWVRDNYQTEKYHGIPVYSWGSPAEAVFEDFYKPPHLDVDGKARPLAATDGNMLIADSVDVVKAMLDASTGASPSLADVPEYALIADRMDSLGVYSMIISKEIPPMILPLQPFLTVGFGNGSDERGAYTAVVAVYDSTDLAANAEDVLNEKLEQVKSQLSKNATVVQRDDRVITVRIYTDDSMLNLGWPDIVNGYRFVISSNN